MTAAETLGHLVLSWLCQHLPSPRNEREPFQPAEWQTRRVLRWYEVDAQGKRCWNRVHDTDPKGKGKSPMAAATAIAEFRGPVHFTGWARGGEVYSCEQGGCTCGWEYEYQGGEPMGIPWGTPGLPSPWVQVAAVSEAQTANTWAALHAFLDANERRAAKVLGLDAGRTLVYWLDRVDAKIERVTASAGTRTGQPITHAVMDEPQEWIPALRGPELVRTILENLTKMDGWAHFTGNAPVLGRESVSELLGYRYIDRHWEKAPPTPRVLFLGVEPRTPPREDMGRDELRPIVRHVYEETPWTPVERILDDAEDRLAYPWSEVWRLFLNLPWDPAVETTGWMPMDAWADCAGTPSLRSTEPAFACVRIAHRHQHAAIAVAQRRPHPDDRTRTMIHLEVRTFAAADGEQVSVGELEAHLRGLRRRFPARVKAIVRTGNRQRERQTSLHGPEIAYAGAFFEGSAQRLRAEDAALIDIPNTPERLAPAAETLLQRASRGELRHDGDPELAAQVANVMATPATKGWKPVPRDPDAPIVAALAAMLAVERAANAPRWKPARLGD